VGLDYNELRFEEYCVEGSYQGLARDFFENALGLSIFSDAARWLGVSGALRGAEAMDSFDAFSKLENDNNEGHSRVGNMICGITELGGIVYVLLCLIILTLAIPLTQVANFFAILIYDVLVIVRAGGRFGTEGIRELADTARDAVPGSKEDREKKQKEKKEKKERKEKE
jgi:hypothetical protein